MIQKSSQYQIKGINQDTAYLVFNPLYAFEMKNIRINATDESSLLSLTNEQGNSLVKILTDRLEELEPDIADNAIEMHVLGTGSFAEYCIIFSTDSSEINDAEKDFIWKFNKDETIELLYHGNLNFNQNYPIKTVCVFENEDIQKVYWVDGLNTPRVINITGDVKVTDLKIDFLPKMTFKESVTVTRTSGGVFPSGTTQYALTYSNKNLQETNIWYVSPLYYNTLPNKGADSNTNCNISYRLDFTNLDTSFDYIQIYVIIRTTLNGTPAVYKISNVSTGITSFTDNGYQWESYDATTLLSKLLNSFVPNLITSKDNTLFLGNYTLTSPDVDTDSEKAFIQEIADNTYIDYLDYDRVERDFPLKEGSKGISTFRDNEWYRLGILFLDEYGTPSNVIYLKDVKPSMGTDYQDPYFKLKVIHSSILNDAPASFKKKFKRARLMMVSRENLPHSTICLGLLCPTIYRVIERYNNSPFAVSSWCMRAANGEPKTVPLWQPDYPLWPNSYKYVGEIQSQNDDVIDNMDNLYWRESKQEGGTTYYYLAKATLLCKGQVDGKVISDFYLECALKILLGRTTNPDVIKNSDCEDKYLKGSIVYLYAYDNGTYDLTTSNGILALTTKIIKDSLATNGCTDAQTIAGRFAALCNLEDFYESFLTFCQGKGYKAAVAGMAYTTFIGAYASSAKTDTTIGASQISSYKLAETANYTLYCDHNILTFHSPDVEKYQTLIDNNDNIKYRVIGYTEMTKTYPSNYVIIDTGPYITSDTSMGLQTVSVKEKDYPLGIYNLPLWKDSKTADKTNNGVFFPVYIWERYASLGALLNNDEDGKMHGQYEKKIMANVHYCNSSKAFFEPSWSEPGLYYPTIKNPSSLTNSTYFDGVSGKDSSGRYSPFSSCATPRVFNSDEMSSLALQTLANSGNINSTLIYYGNVNWELTNGGYTCPILTTKDADIDTTTGIGETDPVMIQYKSTPHVVLPINYKERTYSDTDYYIPPSLPFVNSYINNNLSNTYGYLWSDLEARHVYSNITLNDTQNVIYIAELYLDLTVQDIYGPNNDEDNLTKYTWIPISEWGSTEGCNLTGYGDIFIGRWECLKTYPYSDDDMQSYIDITSVILESDINLDSRYDNYKDIHNATVVTVDKFNQYNEVYNQLNNFFAYKLLKHDSLVNNYQNQICWSSVKSLGEELDTWCQINVGNNTDLQGEYGELRAMVNYQNDLYCFQDNAVYKLNYNTRVAISPSDGQPIQLSNNYTVDPPLVMRLSCGVGTWTGVITTPNGLYFYDDKRKKIFSLSQGQIIELSTIKAINSLLESSGTFDRLFYDTNSTDVYFNFDKHSVTYNEELGEFTSLYDYTSINSLFYIGENSYSIKDETIWKLRNGEYNYFFGEYKPFYILVLANDNPLLDKTFSTVDFTMSSDSQDAFDTLETWNDYQCGASPLTNSVYVPSTLKRKFRIWRANFPRNNKGIPNIGINPSRDRIRGLWSMIKLSKNSSNRNKYRVNNINISYF